MILLIPSLILLILFILFGIYIITIGSIIVVISMQLFTCILMIPFIFEYFKKNLPIIKISFIISNNLFKITIYDKIYIQFFWNDIKEIRLAEEKFTEEYFDYQKKFKLDIFKKNNDIEELRLYNLIIKKKMIQLIIKDLKLNAQSLNVPFIELKEYKKGILREKVEDFQKIQNFIRKSRLDLRLEKKHKHNIF